jgi:hypothetical protein
MRCFAACLRPVRLAPHLGAMCLRRPSKRAAPHASQSSGMDLWAAVRSLQDMTKPARRPRSPWDPRGAAILRLAPPQVASSPKQAQGSACAGLARLSRSGYRPPDPTVVRLNIDPMPSCLVTLFFRQKKQEEM